MLPTALILAALPVVWSEPEAPGLSDRPPIVLFLLADDMRADSIGALGNPVVQTPHLDTLVARGFRFRNAYCLGGNVPAVCMPSRNMLLSGNAYFRWRDFVPPGRPASARGHLAPGDGPNLPLALKAAGYRTYHHGKRGNTAPLIEARFDVCRYLDNDEAERRSGEPGKLIVDAAIAVLAAQPADRPLFLSLAFGNPHDPRVAAPAYRDRYDPAAIPLPRNYLPEHPFDNGELRVRDETLLPWPRTPEAVRQTLHDYYSTVTALDAQIGRLLEALRARGLLDRTLIVFAADQGIALGSHGLLGKQNLYDPSMKAPLVFAGPGVPHGSSDALVSLLDVFPTLCDLVGAPAPAGIDGVSLRPILDGRRAEGRPELLLAYRDGQRAIRDPRWKLIRYPAIGRTQLFDLQADPDEIDDRSGDPDQQARVADLLQRLQRLQRAFGDDLPLDPRP